MEHFNSENEFKLEIDRLNAVSDESSQWSYTNAGKDHIDEFGVEIRSGETYLKRQYGVAFDAVIKLSLKSMEKIVFLLFMNNHELTNIADHLKKVREEKLNEAMKNIFAKLDHDKSEE